MSAIFTLDIGDKPTLSFEARNQRESAELCGEQWLQDEVAQLKSDGISLWDGKAALKTRYASETEKAAFFEGSSEAPFDELVLVYLVRLDASTI
jgi:hypothetical protein